VPFCGALLLFREKASVTCNELLGLDPVSSAVNGEQAFAILLIEGIPSIAVQSQRPTQPCWPV